MIELSHTPILDIPVEGRAKRYMREHIWMDDYERKEGLPDDDNIYAMTVLKDDLVTFEEAVKNKMLC